MPRRPLTATEYDRTVRPHTAWRRAQRTGYRHDRARHVRARRKVPKARRVAVARLGHAAAQRARRRRPAK